MEKPHSPICQCGCGEAIRKHKTESVKRWLSKKYVSREHAKADQKKNNVGWYATS